MFDDGTEGGGADRTNLGSTLRLIGYGYPVTTTLWVCRGDLDAWGSALSGTVPLMEKRTVAVLGGFIRAGGLRASHRIAG